MGVTLATGLAAASLATAALPSISEVQYRLAMRKERKRLDQLAKTGEGGLEPEQRQRMLGEAEAAIQAEEQQAKAEIARMQDPTARQQALQKMQQRGMQARSQARSGVRAADIEAYRGRQQALMAGKYQAAQLAAQRRAATAQAAASMAYMAEGVGKEAGQQKRETTGTNVGQGLAPGARSPVAQSPQTQPARARPTPQSAQARLGLKATQVDGVRAPKWWESNRAYQADIRSSGF